MPRPKKVQPNNPADAADREKATSLTRINKLITSISRSAVKLNESIHNAGVLCIRHAKDFGDTSPAARLVEAMPMSHRRALLVQWFDSFSPIAIGRDPKDEEKRRMKAHLKGKEVERVWNIEGAEATPFYAMPEAEARDQQDIPTFEDVHNKVVSFVDRQKARAEKIADEDQRKKAIAELSALEKALGGKIEVKA